MEGYFPTLEMIFQVPLSFCLGSPHWGISWQVEHKVNPIYQSTHVMLPNLFLLFVCLPQHCSVPYTFHRRLHASQVSIKPSQTISKILLQCF